jgi:hypothetical protein
VLSWIEEYKGLTLVITEGINFVLHGLGPRGVMFTLGGTSEELLSENVDELDPVWSPDGSRLLFGGLAESIRPLGSPTSSIRIFDCQLSAARHLTICVLCVAEWRGDTIPRD